MAKPSMTPQSRRQGAKDSTAARPWLNSYPSDVDWGTPLAPMLMSTLLDAVVKRYPSRPCIYFMGRRLSYAQIGECSDRAAKGLQQLGVGEGVKVGLLLPNSPTFVIFYHGILKAGGVVVNFNPLYSEDELEFQARD